MLFDVIIIGGGPAGLTAGLYTSRAKLKSLLIEKAIPGGQVVTTGWVENYPGFDEGISGPDLSLKMEKQAKNFGLETVHGAVSGIALQGKIKRVTLDDGTLFEAKALIITTGANPKPLNIDGEEKYRGKGVSYCATCDGAFFKGKKIAVIGGGDAAVEEAIFLTRFASEVYMVHRRDKLRATKIIQERAMANQKIKFVCDSVVEKIEGDDTVNSISLKDVKTGQKTKLYVEGVFIYVGYNPNTEFLKGLIDMNKDGYIVTDDRMATSVHGVFAAGDVRAKLLKQIATAVGDGATAAVAVEKYIEESF
ncbi:MAG TPA: thioredoxin-disulfide reductase [Nitrospiraceae bacterium]|nr:thioredoxin-disulfide reductase [Nitrospiraceae bacterium]